PQEMLEKIPTRITDKDGGLGDRINFLIVGPEARMKEAFQQAGWVIVDRTKKDAILRGVLDSISKQGYVTMPMSELYFFGRVQDYGYAHAEPISVVAQRHHLRLWKAPFELEGQTVWVGAATHDIGFERDKRNNGITHKIDPEVDKERDYVVQTLTETGIVVKTAKLTPAIPIKEAKTATGGSFRSDGATHIMYVMGESPLDYSSSFADLFCSVFKQENPDTGEWGECGKYIESPGKTDVALGALTDKYRVLIVPGIMNTCASDAPAFIEGQTHLREKHNITTELLSVPNDSSEANAKQIAAYIQEHSKDDKRKYIVVGYSKGAPDLQVMLATEKDTVPMVAAFVTIAGAVGGSPIADILPVQADRWIKQFGFGGCKGDLSIGFKSLQKAVRQAFLLSYPNPLVPTYSLAAVSDKTNTSKMLLQNWTLLNTFGAAHDSQLTKSDSVVPGAKYLGVARADHFAVGLPLEKLQNGVLKQFLDHGHYPRGALLEAVVRFVTQDLDKAK
ncbi:MAG: LssY C-terminal domain-containing protein, partial [Bryobacteraceae bacterium]